MGNVGYATLQVVPSMRGVQGTLAKELSGQLPDGKKSGSALGGAFVTGMKRVVKTGLAGGALLTGIAAKKGIDRLLGIEDARASLAGLGHDAKSIDKIMGNALDSVRGTAFGMADAGKVAASAVAAGVKPGKDLTANLKLVADAATIAKTDMGSMGAIFNKVAASNKVQGDVIAQLGDMGIPIVQLLAKELGVTAEETLKMASKGQIGFDTFSAAMQEGLGGAALKSGDTTRGAFANMLASLGRVGANLLGGVFPKIKGGFQGVTDLLGPLEEKASGWGDRIGEVLGQVSAKVGPFLSTAKTAIGGFIGEMRSGEGVGGAFVTVIQTTASVLGTVATAIFTTTKFLNEHRTLTAVLASIITAVLLPAIIAWGVQSALAWLKGQIAAVKSSVAQVAAHYRTAAGWARQAAAATASGFTTARIWLMLKTDAIKSAAAQVAAHLRSGAAAVKGAAMQTAAQARVMVSYARMQVSLVASRVAMVASTIATKAFAAAQWLLSKAIGANPIVKLVTVLALVGAALFAAYKKSETFRNIVNGAFSAIKAVAMPVLNWLGTAVAWVIDKVRTHWSTIVAIIGGPIGFAIKHFDKIKAAVRVVREVFSSVVGGIKKAWDKLTGFVEKPIKAIVGVINKFIGAVNKIPGVNLPKINIGGSSGNGADNSSGSQRYATGGAVRGAGTGMSDSIRALLSNGEHVLTAKEVAAMGGHARVEALRAAARAGQFHVPAFASGGRVYPVKGSKKWGKGYKGHTGVDFARPTGTAVYAAHAGTISSIARLATSYGHHIRQGGAGGTSIYAHLSKILVAAGQKIRAGQKIGAVGSTGNSTGPHLHFERRPPGTQAGTGAWLKGAGSPKGGSSVWDKVLGTVKGLTSWFGDKISSMLSGRGIAGGIFGNVGALLRTIGGQIRDGVKDKLFDRGGLASGQGFLAKNSVAPERVLSPRQTAAFERALTRDFEAGSERPIYTDAGVLIGWVRQIARGEAELVWAEGAGLSRLVGGMG